MLFLVCVSFQKELCRLVNELVFTFQCISACMYTKRAYLLLRHPFNLLATLEIIDIEKDIGRSLNIDINTKSYIIFRSPIIHGIKLFFAWSTLNWLPCLFLVYVKLEAFREVLVAFGSPMRSVSFCCSTHCIAAVIYPTYPGYHLL